MKHKKITLLITILFVSLGMLAQAPEKINYQAVARDVSGNPMINSSLTVVFDIKLGSSSGSSVYSETHTPLTNDFGLFTSAIGGGTPNTPFTIADFASINWASGLYYLNVEVNGNPMGATQLLSVPYALHAKTASTGTPGIDGLNCWDLNGNGVKDGTEDVNNDGAWDALDCKGDSGIMGPVGPQGLQGIQGPIGLTGAAGSYTAGSGVDLTGGIITNTAPDQPVVITGTGATVVGGTYPNFTINSSDNVNDADADPNNERISTFSLNGTSDSLVIVEAGVRYASPLSNLNDGDWIINGSDITNGNSGNVGIGTASPSAKNHINIVSPATRALYVTNGNTTANNAAIVQFDANSSLANAFRLERDGQIGIGIGTATAGLHLNNTLRLENMSGNAPDTGFVLTAMDGLGNAEWQPLPTSSLAWVPNGSDIYNNNSGNVGIGITSPTATMHIFSNKDEPYTLLLQATDTNTGGLNIDIAQNIFNGKAINVYNSTFGTDRFTVLNNGNVGINNPTPSNPLDVNGNGVITGTFNVGNAASTTAKTQLWGSGWVNALKVFGNSNAVVMTVASDGKVGINSSNPGAQFEVRESTNGDRSLEVNGRNVSLGDIDGGGAGANLFIDGDGTGKFQFMGGNVGIGVINPSANLHVNDASNTQGTFRLSAGSATGTTTTDGLVFYISGTNAGILNRESTPLNFGTAGANRMTISPTGDVGVGTTIPTAKFHSNGTLRLANLGGTAPSSGSVLTAVDAQGNAEWSNAPLSPSKFGFLNSVYSTNNTSNYSYTPVILTVTPTQSGILNLNAEFGYNFSTSLTSMINVGLYVSTSATPPNSSTGFTSVGKTIGYATAIGTAFASIPVSILYSMNVTAGNTYYIYLGALDGGNSNQTSANLTSPRIIATLNSSSGL